MSQEKAGNVSMENIFRLDGRVPVAKAIPFGLQHVLAMFVSNLAPITIIAGAAQPALSQQEIASLIQNAMFVAGIATMIQLFPVWKVGAKLPIVMGVSFTFVTILSTIAANFGYPTAIGAVLVGGIFEGTLGLLAKYWKKMISPIVSATVVTSIGLSLFTVGARSFGGGYAEDFGSATNLIIASITLLTCIIWSIFVKGYMKQLIVTFFPRASYLFRKFYPICRNSISALFFPFVLFSWYPQQKPLVIQPQWSFPDWIEISPRKKSPVRWLVTVTLPRFLLSSDVPRLLPSLRMSD